MPKSKPDKPKDHCLVLQGDLTIYRAEELKAQLLAALESDAEVEVDLHEVTALDTAGMQVLMAAKAEAQTRGNQMRLVNHSKPVIEVFELLNVSGFFGDPLLLSSGQSGGARERV